MQSCVRLSSDHLPCSVLYSSGAPLCFSGIQCGDFSLIQPFHTFNPSDQPPPDPSTHQAPPPEESRTIEQLCPEGKCGSKCHGVFTDRCDIKCLPSWYPKSPRSPVREKVTYVCEARHEDGTVAIGQGAWIPSDSWKGSPLQCEHGVLSHANSIFHLNNNTRVAKVAKAFRSTIDDPILYPGGGLCKHDRNRHGCFDGHLLAPDKGPEIEFVLTAHDDHGRPRNYDTLNAPPVSTVEMPDAVYVTIERVPLDMLPENACQLYSQTPVCEKELQPTTEAGELVNYAGVGRTGVLSSISTPAYVAVNKETRGSDGKWKIQHQFHGHGVFFLSIHICRNDVSENDCKTNHDNLVPGTGLNGKILPVSAFTICPQNTMNLNSNEGSRIVEGAQLRTCRSSIGFFSPPGPGHIAAHCDVGFACKLQSMTWPVAMPGFWVGQSVPVKMSKCTRTGACPGGVFATPNLTKSCPSNKNGDLWTTFHGPGTLPPWNAGKPWDNFNESDTTNQPADDCYQVPQKISPKTNMPFVSTENCLARVGHQCCYGTKGESCGECCTVDDSGGNCNSKQWTTTGRTDEDTTCTQCLDKDLPWIWLVVLGAVAVVLGPVLAYLSSLAKHAGAATGPIFSVINFMQSASLFQGLDLNWPEPFVKFCRTVTSWFSSLNIFETIMQVLDFPTPACAFNLSYIQKWYLYMLSPVLIMVLVILVMLVGDILIWNAFGGKIAWGYIKRCVSLVWKSTKNGCVMCLMCAGPEVYQQLTEEPDQLRKTGWRHTKGLNAMVRMSQPEPEPEPEPEPAMELEQVYQPEPEPEPEFGSFSDAFDSGVLEGSGVMMKMQRLSQMKADASTANLELYQWEYRVRYQDRGSWKPFDETQQAELNAALNRLMESRSSNIDHTADRLVVLTRSPDQKFEYEIDLLEMQQCNTSTGRKRKTRRVPRGNRIWRAFAAHDYNASMRSMWRILLLYLMIGYTYLSGKSVEPLACVSDLDSTSSVAQAQSINCDWCDLTRYRVIGAVQLISPADSVVANGIANDFQAWDESGSWEPKPPEAVSEVDLNDWRCLEWTITPDPFVADVRTASCECVETLADHTKRPISSWFCWSVSYRELASWAVVSLVMYGMGIPMLLGCVLWRHASRGELQTNEFAAAFGFLSTKMKTDYFYWEVLISFRKLALVLATKLSDQQRLPCSLINLFTAVGAFGLQVWKMPFASHDANAAESLTLLSTILILVLGLAQKAKDEDDRTNASTYDQVKKINNFLEVMNYVIYTAMFLMVGASISIVLRRLRGALFNLRHLSKLEDAANDDRQVPNEVRRMLDKKWLLVSSAWAAIKAKEPDDDSHKALKVGHRVRLNDGVGGSDAKLGRFGRVREIGRAGTDQYLVEILGDAGTTAQENAWLSRDQLEQEGDIMRMKRVFENAQQFKDTKPMQRWQKIFTDWETFFPEIDRQVMHAWAPFASEDDIKSMLWLMHVWKKMEKEQHEFKIPKWDSTFGKTRLENTFGKKCVQCWCCYKNEDDNDEDEYERALMEIFNGADLLPSDFDDRKTFGGALSIANAVQSGSSSPSQRDVTDNLSSLAAAKERAEETARAESDKQPHKQCAALVRTHFEERHFGQTKEDGPGRATRLVLWLLLSSVLTVLCVVRMGASASERPFAGLATVKSPLEVCKNAQNRDFTFWAWVLIVYWTFCFLVEAVGLWKYLRRGKPLCCCKGCTRCPQEVTSKVVIRDATRHPNVSFGANLQTGPRSPTSRPVSPSSDAANAGLTPADLGMSRTSSLTSEVDESVDENSMTLSAGPEPEPDPQSRPGSTNTIDYGYDYDSGGEDDPNWKQKAGSRRRGGKSLTDSVAARLGGAE